MKKITIYIIIFTLLTACNKNGGKPAGFDYGRVENNMYKNDFFRTSMQLPAGWTVMDDQQKQEMTQMGYEMAAGNNKNIQNVIDAGKVNSATLLSVFEDNIVNVLSFFFCKLI